MKNVVPFVVLLGISLARPPAIHANDMDLSLARLRIGTDVETLPPGCEVSSNNIPRDFCPDNDAWRRVMSQFGIALAPPLLVPARTTGYGGFSLAFEGSVTGISQSEDYWELGTEGNERAGMDMRNSDVDSTIFAWRLAFRKGLPFGFELGTSFGGAANTSLWMWGLELKWALFEGFRTGIGVLPDVAVRSAVHVVTGDAEFSLAIPTLDLIISKPIVLAHQMTVSPYVAGQLLWVIARSELIDLTPGVDAVDECRPDVNQPREGDVSTIRCTRTDPLPDGRVPGQDLNNNAVFSDVHALRARLALGVQAKYQLVTLTGVFTFDLLKPGSIDHDISSDLPRQWTIAFGAGLAL